MVDVETGFWWIAVWWIAGLGLVGGEWKWPDCTWHRAWRARRGEALPGSGGKGKKKFFDNLF
jgi:hypothetical protein